MADDTKPAEESGFAYNPFAAPDPEPEPAPEPEPEPVPASMSMTKSELLERLDEVASDLTKAQILAHIQQIEGGDDASAPADVPQQVPADTATRTVTIDGVVYTWTAATEDTVPAAAREVWAQSQAAGG
jgi:hypothetical protein